MSFNLFMRNPAAKSFKILCPSKAKFEWFPFGPRAIARPGQIPRAAPQCLRTPPTRALPPLALTRQKSRASPSPQLACPPPPADPALHPAPATRRLASATAIPGRQYPRAQDRRRVLAPSSDGLDPPGCAASLPQPRQRNAHDSSSLAAYRRQDGARLRARVPLVGVYV